MNVLVIGGTGFIGQHLMRYFVAEGTSTVEKRGFIKLDITDRNSLKKVIEKTKPSVVINSSGMTAVDECERRPEDAMKINGKSVEALSSICHKKKIKFIQISTDYVFDGKSGSYREQDRTNPVNQYGLSKLEGEKAALMHDGIVLRISTPYGVNYIHRKETFFDFVIENLTFGNEIRIVNDQFTTPTFVNDIPRAIMELIRSDESGIFHLGLREKISRYDFAIKIAEFFGLEKEKIIPVSLDDISFLAERPRDSSLNVNKITRYLFMESLDGSMEMIRNSYNQS